jgi:hypothetical protein
MDLWGNSFSGKQYETARHLFRIEGALASECCYNSPHSRMTKDLGDGDTQEAENAMIMLRSDTTNLYHLFQFICISQSNLQNLLPANRV